MLALALALVPLPFVDGFAAMTGVLFLAGFAISPTLIASIALIEETVPASRLTEGIATMTTGMYAGLAPAPRSSARSWTGTAPRRATG